MKDPPYRTKNMMPGMIMLWYGSRASIPSGWTLCDGTMGTPNLVGKTVKGAKLIPAPGATGGVPTHDHDFTGNGHSHTIPEGTGLAAGTDYALETEEDPAIGTTEGKIAEPPWHALCYIMKL